MITGKLYDVLKWIAIAGLPWLGTTFLAVEAVLTANGFAGIPYAGLVGDLIVVAATALGTLLAVSSATYYKKMQDGEGEGTDE